MSKIYKVIVCGMRGKKIAIHLCNKEELKKRMTALRVKEKIAERLSKYGDTARLNFTNKKLFGDSTELSEYGIQHMSIIQMVERLAGGGWPGGGIGGTGDGGMGDKGGKNRSIEKLPDF